MMDEKTAREILGGAVSDKGNQLYQQNPEIAFVPSYKTIILHGEFDREKLEAILWWMKNK